MSEHVGSVTCKKSSDFQSRFTIRWELEDKIFLKIDICLDDSVKYRIMAIKTNENFTPLISPIVWLSESLEGRLW